MNMCGARMIESWDRQTTGGQMQLKRSEYEMKCIKLYLA